MLRDVAGILRAISKPEDVVGRIGGDEFVFFTEVSELETGVEAMAQRICYAINSIKLRDEYGDRVSGSVGAAVAPADGNDYDTLVQKADENVYRAKRNGKNTYSY